jgi:hypothetical protein
MEVPEIITKRLLPEIITKRLAELNRYISELEEQLGPFLEEREALQIAIDAIRSKGAPAGTQEDIERIAATHQNMLPAVAAWTWPSAEPIPHLPSADKGETPEGLLPTISERILGALTEPMTALQIAHVLDVPVAKVSPRLTTLYQRGQLTHEGNLWGPTAG